MDNVNGGGPLVDWAASTKQIYVMEFEMFSLPRSERTGIWQKQQNQEYAIKRTRFVFFTFLIKK